MTGLDFDTHKYTKQSHIWYTNKDEDGQYSDTQYNTQYTQYNDT